MNWINIHTTFLRSPEFMSANSTHQAAWLKLLGYCSEQENGGVIKGARLWQPVQWCYACCVTFEEVSQPSSLWKWRGDDFVLHAYPKSKEDEVRAKRESGKRGGKHSGEARREAQLRSTASPESEAQLRTERKGKEEEGERKEKGKEKKQPAAGIVFPEGFPESHIPALTEWFAYKRERKESYTPTGWIKLCNTQSQFPAAQVQASVDNSMANNWAGLFTEKTTVPDRPDESERRPDLSKMTVDERISYFRQSCPERDWPFLQPDGSLDLVAKMKHNKARKEAELRAEEGEPAPDVPWDRGDEPF